MCCEEASPSETSAGKSVVYMFMYVSALISVEVGAGDGPGSRAKCDVFSSLAGPPLASRLAPGSLPSFALPPAFSSCIIALHLLKKYQAAQRNWWRAVGRRPAVKPCAGPPIPDPMLCLHISVPVPLSHNLHAKVSMFVRFCACFACFD